MVGSALVRRLAREDCEIVTATRQDADLIRQDQAEALMARLKPDAVFIPAAKVGGILANDTYPAGFLYENLMIAANLIHAAHQVEVEKLLFLARRASIPSWRPSRSWKTRS